MIKSKPICMAICMTVTSVRMAMGACLGALPSATSPNKADGQATLDVTRQLLAKGFHIRNHANLDVSVDCRADAGEPARLRIANPVLPESWDVIKTIEELQLYAAVWDREVAALKKETAALDVLSLYSRGLLLYERQRTLSPNWSIWSNLSIADQTIDRLEGTPLTPYGAVVSAKSGVRLAYEGSDGELCSIVEVKELHALRTTLEGTAKLRCFRGEGLRFADAHEQFARKAKWIEERIRTGGTFLNQQSGCDEARAMKAEVRRLSGRTDADGWNPLLAYSEWLTGGRDSQALRREIRDSDPCAQ